MREYIHVEDAARAVLQFWMRISQSTCGTNRTRADAGF